jgi:hypothetical protein
LRTKALVSPKNILGGSCRLDRFFGFAPLLYPLDNPGRPPSRFPFESQYKKHKNVDKGNYHEPAPPGRTPDLSGYRAPDDPRRPNVYDRYQEKQNPLPALARRPDQQQFLAYRQPRKPPRTDAARAPGDAHYRNADQRVKNYVEKIFHDLCY